MEKWYSMKRLILLSTLFLLLLLISCKPEERIVDISEGSSEIAKYLSEIMDDSATIFEDDSVKIIINPTLKVDGSKELESSPLKKLSFSIQESHI